jgi:dTDP-4-amino-4,6-dideoxygalactose transaminase
MALTNDAELAERLSTLRSHGITRAPERFRLAAQSPGSAGAPAAGHGGWYYEQQILGFNYRITDIQAALGTSQMQRLSAYVERRNQLARRYDRALQGLPLRLPFVEPENLCAFHLYVIRLQVAETRRSHRELYDDLRTAGIGANVHYLPVHLQPYYRDAGFSPGQFPEAEDHGRQAITLPLFPGLTEQAQDQVVHAVRHALQD